MSYVARSRTKMSFVSSPSFSALSLLQLEVTCTNDLVSEKCTNFDSSLTDVDTLAGGEGEVAVMKLLPASEVTASDAVDYSDAEDYDDAVGYFADLWNDAHTDSSSASSRNVGAAGFAKMRGFAVAALASVAAHALM